MTTTVKVHVNGNYITTVRKTNRQSGEVTEDVIDASGQNGGVERSYSLGHPADADFQISERYAHDPATHNEATGLPKSEGEVNPSPDQQGEHADKS